VHGIDGGRVSEAAAARRVQSNHDQVQVSAGARLLGRVIAAVHAAPEVDAAVVSALQSQIDAGTYQVNPGAVAQSMLGQGAA